MSSNVMTFKEANFIERLVLKKYFWLTLSLFLFAYPIYRSVNRELPPDLPVLYVLPEFELIDENGKKFGTKNLKGKPYIANFHFTSCPTVCPEVMKKTQLVQKRIRGLGDKVQIVSFSVDPKNDSSKVLFDHAREVKANPYVWKFLTGETEVLKNLINNGFKLSFGDKANLEDDIYDIAHSMKFVLVDEMGRVRSYYSMNKNSIDKMMIDLGLLINKLIHGHGRSS